MSYRPSITLAAMSVVFFLITATTFSSLGVVLPAMIGELHWSWGAAGTGFSLLGVAVGITSTIPASMIRRLGVRATLVTGSLVMGLAFLCLAVTHGLILYFLGCLLAGLGFTLLATVPGTYLLTRLFAQPSFPFGLYFTVGGLGGVAGPILYLWVQSAAQNWRAYWLVSLVIVTVAGLLSAVLVDTKTDVRAGEEDDPHITGDAWTAKAALKTPQFAVLAAAYSIFPFVGITVSAVAVGHLMRHGVGVALAGGAMSLEALFNAGARFMGGVLVRWISAKTLLLFALGLMIMGLMALSVAHGTDLMIVYAVGVGAGYGLTFFASTIMLLDYFGRGPNLELFATVNLISTAGAAGPAFAGFVSDHAGSFVPAFVILEALALIVLIGVAPMRAPKRRVGA
ncbi:MAG TPA: MFS transporter [Rhizomicrobium sp.]|jgi:OFA family oxalate/formate antiporter-like MFS transporter|nr:MFS transporter [Rhizomicrobium sp.]